MAYYDLISPQGTWADDVQYLIESVVGAAAAGLIYRSCPAVIFEGTVYVAKGIIQPTLGTPPTSDSAWSVFASSGGGGGGNFQGYWQAATNSPTLVNGTGTAGFFYINTSTGTNIVNFGAGPISFAQNDAVEYNSMGQWINIGQAAGVTSVVSSAPNLLSAVTASGVVTLTPVNANQTSSATNVFDPTKTDLYLIGAVNMDVSLMVLNRQYGVTAVGGSTTITAINGSFVGGGTVTITSGDSVIFKKVASNQVNVY